uniref:CSON014354 protein n=1 Tax=Culicoides sonorensis TaxID=179676 RepID=A0A336MMQ6_CULSO
MEWLEDQYPGHNKCGHEASNISFHLVDHPTVFVYIDLFSAAASNNRALSLNIPTVLRLKVPAARNSIVYPSNVWASLTRRRGVLMFSNCSPK